MGLKSRGSRARSRNGKKFSLTRACGKGVQTGRFTEVLICDVLSPCLPPLSPFSQRHKADLNSHNSPRRNILSLPVVSR